VSIRGSVPLVTRRSRRCVRGVLQHRPLPPAGSLPSALSATVPHGPCSRVSPVLWTHPTPRLFPDSFASSASCRGPRSLMRRRARRGLPGSDALLSNVMWPSTSAGRQHLAFAVPHILPSAVVNASAPAMSVFRGSISHPIRSLCTLRRGRHLPRRNTRYQADATPYLGRTCTGWIAPASPGAPPPTPCRSPGAPV